MVTHDQVRVTVPRIGGFSHWVDRPRPGEELFEILRYEGGRRVTHVAFIASTRFLSQPGFDAMQFIDYKLRQLLDGGH